MKQIAGIFAFLVALSLAAVPAANAGYKLSRFDCDTSHGISGFMQDYFVNNGTQLLYAAWSLVPKPIKSQLNGPDGHLTANFDKFKWLVTLLHIGVKQDTAPRLDLNAITHFACFSIINSDEEAPTPAVIAPAP